MGLLIFMTCSVGIAVGGRPAVRRRDEWGQAMLGVAQGRTDAQIAAELYFSIRTNRTEAVTRARELGLIP